MKQSRLTGAISVSIAQAMVLLLGYVTHLIIGRILGPGPYGTYGVVLSIQTIFGLILTLGAPMAISRFVAQDEAHARAIFRQALRIQAVIALAIAGITALSAPLLAHVLDDLSLTPIIQFVAIVIFTQSFYTVFSQFLSGMHRFNRQAALTATYAVAKLVGAIVLIYLLNAIGLGVYGAFAGFSVGGIVAAILGWYWTRGAGGNKPKKLPLKAFLSFAGMYVLILLGLQILISLDLFMVKAFLENDIETGFYNASVTLARIPYMLLQGLMFIILPSVAALTRPGASHDEAAAFIRDTLRYLIALIVPAVALAAATSKSLVILFYSHEFIPAAASLTILMVGLGALAFYLLLANIAAGAGREKVAFGITVLILIVSAIAGPILIPRFGLIGAAWQTTIAGLLGLAIMSAYTFRTFRIPLPIKSTINILIATVIAVGITYFWKATALALIPQYIVVFIIYTVVLWLLGEITAADRHRIASIHRKLNWVAPQRPNQEV